MARGHIDSLQGWAETLNPNQSQALRMRQACSSNHLPKDDDAVRRLVGLVALLVRLLPPEKQTRYDKTTLVRAPGYD